MAAIPGMPETSRPEPVEHQRLRLLFKQAQTTSAVAVVAAIACTFVFYQASPGLAPLLWLAGVILAAALRFGLYRQFFSTDIGRRCEGDWLRWSAWTGAFIGVTWGAVAAIDLSDAGQHAQNIQT